MPVLAALIAVIGCRRTDKPDKASSAGDPMSEEPPRLTLIAPESASWSRAEALDRLADEKLDISAAVRLVRLADVWPLCVPQELTDATVSRLRLRLLCDGAWALGFADLRSGGVLHAPLLIGADGAVLAVAAGTEEEALTLHVSGDADVFPHLLISPLRVLIAEVPPRLVLTLQSPLTVGFRGRERDGYSYVGLMSRGAAGWVEAAMYRWEPYELAFAGPASDKLPDPPGGRFVLDMAASPLLIPVGGEIPATQPIPSPVDYKPGRFDV